MGDSFLHYFFPPLCVLCRKVEPSSLCEDCREQMPLLTSPRCSICGAPFDSPTALSHPCALCLQQKPIYDWHRSAMAYQSPFKNLLHRYKYEGDFQSMELFTSWLEILLREIPLPPDFIVPVPLSLGRLRERTFNQSLEWAKVLGKKRGWMVLKNSLRKIKNTPPQTGLSREERLRNLKDVFSWKGEALQGKKLLLVDDVYTTGATLSSCARVLKEEGAAFVGAVTLAFNPKRIH